MVDGTGAEQEGVPAKVLYTGSNAEAVAEALSAALPSSGVLYYTIEASDSAK